MIAKIAPTLRVRHGDILTEWASEYGVVSKAVCLKQARSHIADIDRE